MKNWFVFILFCMLISSATAQTPYTAREAKAIAAIKARASSDGYTNPQLTGVATVKGNYPLGLITINNKFNLGSETNSTNDQDKGKATFWGYLVRSAAKPDSSRAYITVDAGSLLGGFVVFDAPAGIDKKTLPGNFSLNLPTNTDGSPSWMNTDEVVTRLRTNNLYQQYRATHADSTPDYVALGMSKAAAGQFPAGEPLWAVVFTGQSTSDFLSCNVHALTGAVECLVAPTSVEENSFKSTFTVSPNPARGSVSVQIPTELFSPDGTIELFNLLGEKMYSFKMSGAGEGYWVIIPVENYSAGMYFVRYTNGTQALTQALTIE
ncbi:MAG: T9SS type A sorting domain-containing protein [Bacteroidota bacterium]